MRSAGRSNKPEKGLPAVAALRQEVEALERHHVATAVADGWSWSRVAEALGVSKQAAHKKHARMARALTTTDPREAVPGNDRVTVTPEARRAVRCGRDEARAVGLTHRRHRASAAGRAASRREERAPRGRSRRRA